MGVVNTAAILAGNNRQIGMKQTQDLDAGKRAPYLAGDPFELGPPFLVRCSCSGISHSPDETARSSRVPRLKFRVLTGMRQLVPQIWHLGGDGFVQALVGSSRTSLRL